MKPMMIKTLLLAFCTLCCLHFSVAAENFSKELRGKVITSNKSNISIYLLDRAGTILDITKPDQQGNFRLDLSVMDLPVYEEVNKLQLRISDKKGNDKQVKVAEELNNFDTTSTLKPLVFP